MTRQQSFARQLHLHVGSHARSLPAACRLRRCSSPSRIETHRHSAAVQKSKAAPLRRSLFRTRARAPGPSSLPRKSPTSRRSFRRPAPPPGPLNTSARGLMTKLSVASRKYIVPRRWSGLSTSQPAMPIAMPPMPSGVAAQVDDQAVARHTALHRVAEAAHHPHQIQKHIEAHITRVADLFRFEENVHRRQISEPRHLAALRPQFQIACHLACSLRPETRI